MIRLNINLIRDFFILFWFLNVIVWNDFCKEKLFSGCGNWWHNYGYVFDVLEYIEVEQQEKYVEMINMAATQKGVIALIQEDGMKKGERRGFRRGKKEIISNILLTLSIEETASLLGWSVDEVNEVLKD